MELRSRLNGCKRAGREEPVGFARLDPVATTGPRTRFSQTVQATCGSCGPVVDISGLLPMRLTSNPRSPARRIRPRAAAPARRESRLRPLSDGCCGPGFDGDANRACEPPADHLAHLDRLLIKAGQLRRALECELLVGDLVAVHVVRAARVAESIPRQVLLELAHRANMSHPHVETVKILAGDATGYPAASIYAGLRCHTPNGIRTRVAALKGRRPRPLADGGAARRIRGRGRAADGQAAGTEPDAARASIACSCSQAASSTAEYSSGSACRIVSR